MKSNHVIVYFELQPSVPVPFHHFRLCRNNKVIQSQLRCKLKTAFLVNYNGSCVSSLGLWLRLMLARPERLTETRLTSEQHSATTTKPLCASDLTPTTSGRALQDPAACAIQETYGRYVRHLRIALKYAYFIRAGTRIYENCLMLRSDFVSDDVGVMRTPLTIEAEVSQPR